MYLKSANFPGNRTHCIQSTHSLQCLINKCDNFTYCWLSHYFPLGHKMICKLISTNCQLLFVFINSIFIKLLSLKYKLDWFQMNPFLFFFKLPPPSSPPRTHTNTHTAVQQIDSRSEIASILASKELCPKVYYVSCFVYCISFLSIIKLYRGCAPS